MAIKVFTNCQFGVNGNDLSAWVSQVTLNYAAEMLDDTVMGDLTRSRLGGLKVWSMAVGFKDDFCSTGPSNEIWSLVGCQSCVQFRPVNACSTVSNPYYWGIACPEGIPAIGGAVGTLAEYTVNFNSAGALTRTTACWGA